jgi:hypothetical protein
VKADLGRAWKTEVRYQYAHDLAWSGARNFSKENSDIDLGFVEGKQARGILTIGRQKITVGKQRLIGTLEWSNTPRSYDGVRFRAKEWDLWAAKIGLGPVVPRDVVLAGATFRSSTSLILKHDKVATGNVDHGTLTHLGERRLGGFNVDYEAAIQLGRAAGKRLETWAFHGRATRRVLRNTAAYVEINSASGGAAGDVVRTFDNLYPTNHPFYGLMDLQGWRNMQELSFGIDHTLRKGLAARLEWHGFGLRDSQDAWYGAAGAPNRWSGGVFRDATGAAGREVGSELDLELTWTANAKTNVSAGISSFNPGRFVRTLRGAGDRQTWGYVQAQFRF